MQTPLASSRAVGYGLGVSRPAPAGGGTPAFDYADYGPLAVLLDAAAGVLDGDGNPCSDATPGTTDLVATWQDQSGNGHHRTQATSGKRPVLKTGIVNGKPVLRFVASSAQELGGTLAAIPQPFTVFVVLTLAGPARNQDEVFGGGAVSFYVSAGFGDLYATTGYTGCGAGAGGTAYTAPRGPDVLSVLADGASSKWWVNGALTATGNAGTGSLADLKVGNSVFGSNFNGDVAKFVLYADGLDDADREAVQTQLATEFAL